MSDVIEVSPGWLALREPEDARSRSRELANAAAALLPAGPVVVHDLGSGTGSMMRWLAPMLSGPQHWVLHDWNSHLTEQALAAPIARDAQTRAVSVATRVGDLAELTSADLDGASLVTASALLDVLTSQEVDSLARSCITVGAPALLSLSVTGRVDLVPAHPLDRELEDAFNAHQRRASAGRQLLGRHAHMIAAGHFLEAGWHVRTDKTYWRLGNGDPRLLCGWWEGWIGAALEQRPELRDSCDEYLGVRAAQLRNGMLSATIEHADLLAWPR